ncbi:MerR family transcriptional regulator, partial [Ruminococcaceae bacterium OttesenSCG-928-I18]|nr:MerR family transcriptional regulator [Ruminococcaceae bacterium OttesenSCG-928-I18]
MQRRKQRYNIGEVSNISGLSIKSLRYYDKKGVLVPSTRDVQNNYRYYSESQLLEALAIREMKLRGFLLQEMETVLMS